jgi:hypothetical protein
MTLHQMREAKHAAEKIAAVIAEHNSGGPYDPAKVAAAEAAVKAALVAVVAALESKAPTE